MEEVDKEISETRLSLNARARIVAESYLATVCLVHSFKLRVDNHLFSLVKSIAIVFLDE